jgi:hypothetical protein
MSAWNKEKSFFTAKDALDAEETFHIRFPAFTVRFTPVM